MESIAWDVVGMIVPFLGNKDTAELGSQVLDLLVMKGNAKEVFLKCVEALKGIQYSRDVNDNDNEEEEEPVWTCAKSSTRVSILVAVDQFTSWAVVIEAATTCRGS